MPLDRPVDFLAVDEIQLCADPERGHVFTARLLHARGLAETMLLGADTIRPLMRRLVPEFEHVGRPRFSTLSYTGHKKVTRLPPRSAVVAFAVADVFSLAELIRRQRGGTAVVLGALSPRARNAQVGDVPGRRGRLPGRHRRDRHGPQHGPRPCRLCPHRQIRRPRAAPPDRRRDRPDRRPRRAPYERRHLWHHRRRRAARPRDRRGGRSPSLRSVDPAQLAQHQAALRFGRRAPQKPRRAPAPPRPHSGPRSRRPARLAGARAQPRGGRARRPPRRGAALLGSLPDPRFPQGHERQPRAALGAYLQAPRRTRRAAARRVGRRADGQSRPRSTAISTR